MVCQKVREHVLTLHHQGFVHSDIRPLNVLVKCPIAGYRALSVQLVDFDWAGETNKVKYPFSVNPDLGNRFRRPSGVKGGGIITPAHDLAMVDLMYNTCTLLSPRLVSCNADCGDQNLMILGLCTQDIDHSQAPECSQRVEI